MTLDVTVVVWLDRGKLRLPDIDEAGVSFRFLSAEDIRQLAVDDGLELHASMADRLEGSRDHCFAAFCGERLASYAWFARQSIEAQHNRGSQPKSGVSVSFPSHVAFLYKGFTHPEFRGRKLHGAAVGRGLLGLAPYGVNIVLSTTDWTNRAARKALGGIGFEELGLCFRWGWGEWMHTRAPAEAVRRGARFDAAAKADSFLS